MPKPKEPFYPVGPHQHECFGCSRRHRYVCRRDKCRFTLKKDCPAAMAKPSKI